MPTPAGLQVDETFATVDTSGNGPLATAARGRSPVYTEDASHELVLKDRTCVHASSAVLPLVTRGACMGLVVVARRGIYVFETETRLSAFCR